MALDFVAGCLGGLTGVGVGHPFDTVKVRLQTQPAGTYRGTYHCFSSIVRKEGLLGFYKGITSPMAGLSFINAIVFGVNGSVLRQMQNPDTLPSIFTAGLGVPVYFHVFFMPFHSHEAKAAYLAERYHNPLHCALKIKRDNGVFRGLYRGFTLTMIRDCLGFGVYFSSYSYFVGIFNSDTDSQSSSSLGYFLAGGIGGTVSWLLNYPVDVIKSKFQADGGSGAFKYKNYGECFRMTYQEQGWRGFTVGLNSTLLRAFPMNAVTFLTIEWVYKLLGKESLSAVSSNDNLDTPSTEYIIAKKQEQREKTRQLSTATGSSILHP